MKLFIQISLLLISQLSFFCHSAITTGTADIKNNKEKHKESYWESCGADENGNGGTFCFKSKEICFDGKCYCRKGMMTTNNNHCGTDINECQQENNPCDTINGVCVNKNAYDGYYQCWCKKRYVGVEEGEHGPTRCIAESSCFFNSCTTQNTECKEMSENHYECQCRSGYAGNGIFCQKKEKSSHRRDECNKTCTNKRTKWMIQRNRKNKNCNTLPKERLIAMCKNHVTWANRKWCQLSCFNVGQGYDDDICCNKE